VFFRNQDPCFYGMLCWGGHVRACALHDCAVLFAIRAAQISSREFCLVSSPERTRRTQRSCCPQIPSAPIYTDFLQSGKEEIETELPAFCFPYLICRDLRNLRIANLRVSRGLRG